MSDILKELETKTVRWEMDGIKLFIPTLEQSEEIKEMMRKELEIDKLDKNTQLSSDITRHVLRELTSLGDTIDRYDDDELIVLINRDRRLILLYREVEKLLSEFADDIKYEINQKSEELMNLLQSIVDMNSIAGKEKEINRILKENGINETVESIVAKSDEREKLKKLKEEEMQNKLVEKMTKEMEEMGESTKQVLKDINK